MKELKESWARYVRSDSIEAMQLNFDDVKPGTVITVEGHSARTGDWLCRNEGESETYIIPAAEFDFEPAEKPIEVKVK